MNNQSVFIAQCKEKVEDGNFANDLAALIGVNVDAAYRRIRGVTALTYHEIEKMCVHYSVSFDSVINYHGRLVPFQFNAMFREGFSIEVYLQQISDQLKELATSQESRFVITAMDLPYFRQFGFKGLSQFKLFFWQRSVLNLPDFRSKKFDLSSEPSNYDALTQSIFENYYQVSSTEIWTPESVDSSIKQIEYYFDAGMFEDDTIAAKLCDELTELIENVQKEAEFGRKQIQTKDGTKSARFEMYQSDIFLSNNSIQAYNKGRVYTYLSFNSFNSLMSFSPSFSDECHEWIEQIRIKSILLSEVSEKLRYQYFLGLQKKIDRLRVKVSE
ncbi:MAG: hypothetical protein ACI8SE_000253 [Bacteroidia bacterium]|jgi:hypothetical protein